MIFLLFLWVASLAVLLLLGGLGFRATSARGVAGVSSHSYSFGEFFVREAHHLFGILHRLLQALHPHALRATSVVVDNAARGVERSHAFVMRKIFGKIEVEKGPAPSFYLKNIAETKAETKSDGVEQI